MRAGLNIPWLAILQNNAGFVVNLTINNTNRDQRLMAPLLRLQDDGRGTLSIYYSLETNTYNTPTST